jgi:hypothetical protein
MSQSESNGNRSWRDGLQLAIAGGALLATVFATHLALSTSSRHEWSRSTYFTQPASFSAGQQVTLEICLAFVFLVTYPRRQASSRHVFLALWFSTLLLVVFSDAVCIHLAWFDLLVDSGRFGLVR